jgi:hypothetical protein
VTRLVMFLEPEMFPDDVCRDWKVFRFVDLIVFVDTSVKHFLVTSHVQYP